MWPAIQHLVIVADCLRLFATASFHHMTSVQPNGGAELLASFAATNPALHTHLTNLITHLIQHQPANPFQHIEQLSAQLAQLTNNNNNTNAATTPYTPAASLASYLDETPYIFNKRPPPPAATNADGDDTTAEEEEDVPIPAIIPNIASLASLLREAGIALPADEALLVDKAMIALLKGKDNIDSVRFWGKLHTTSTTDYYVYELKKSAYDDDEERDRVAREKALAETGLDVSEGRELYGSGTNEYVYFVTQSIATPSPVFTQLPAALPRYVADSRRSRRFLTGSLSAAVGGFPPFIGTEADLLRSIIARVSSGSVVVPKGSWREEEGDVVIEDDTWRGVVRGETVGWSHVRGKLRRDGRVEPVEEEAAEGEEEESEEKKATRAASFEAKAPLLSATSAAHFSYRSSTALDTAQLPPPPAAADSDEPAPPTATSHVTHSVHSLAWPGSVSVVRGREYGSIYIGWGLRQAVANESVWTVGGVSGMEREWAGGELVEQVEVAATEEEEKREREEEEERKKEEGEKKDEDDADELPDEEEEKPEDE